MDSPGPLRLPASDFAYVVTVNKFVYLPARTYLSAVAVNAVVPREHCMGMKPSEWLKLYCAVMVVPKQ